MVHTVDSYVYPLDSSATLYNEPNFSAEVLEQCQEETDALVAATNGELTGAGGDVSNPIKNRLRVAKCIVVGDISVGKTCLINRFGYNVFTDDYKTTIGVDFDVQKFDILKRPFSLQVSSFAFFAWQYFTKTFSAIAICLSISLVNNIAIIGVCTLCLQNN